MMSPEFTQPLKTILHSPVGEGIRDALAYYANQSCWPQIEHLNQHPLLRLNETISGSGVPIKFVQSPSTRARGFNTLYQPRIFLKGEVATRQVNWHDFFNALVWLSFPKIKAYINRRHFFIYDAAAEFPWTRNAPLRNKEQDALTIFDEGGAIAVVKNQQLIDEYKTLSTDERKAWVNQHLNKSLKVFIFGHAVYEVLLLDHRDILASGIWLVGGEGFFEKNTAAQLREADAAAGQWLNQKKASLVTKDFIAVPVNAIHNQSPSPRFQAN